MTFKNKNATALSNDLLALQSDGDYNPDWAYNFYWDSRELTYIVSDETTFSQSWMQRLATGTNAAIVKFIQNNIGYVNSFSK